MKRTNPPLLKIFPLLLCLLCTNSLWAQPLELSIQGIGPNHYEGCEKYEVTFTAVVPGSATVDDIELVSADKSQTYVRKNDWIVSSSGRSFTFTYSFTAGKYNPILRVKRGGADWEEELLDKTINVYSLPRAMYRITSDSSQCLKENEFFFKNLSVPGVEKHTIVSWTFDLGDGKFVDDKDSFSYTYIEPGIQTTILTIIDEKGCTNEHKIDNHLEVYSEIGAEFGVSDEVGCPCADIRFNNRTKLDEDKVDSWVWDWGTGGKKSKDTFYMSNPDHRDNWWTGFRRRYCKDGYHSPKLVVTSKDGCKDSVILKDAIRAVNYNFDITWVPDTTCFTGNNVRFNMPPRSNAFTNEWNFGDPASQLLNTARDDWSPAHSFVGGPGFYNVSLSILELPCPRRDTTICFIKLKGPMAMITLNPNAFPNNCIDPKEIPISHFQRLQYDECFRESMGFAPNDDLVTWVTANTNTRQKVDSYFVYCNAKVVGQTPNNAISALGAGTADCNNQFVTRNIPVLETPNNGVNGNWRYQYRGFTQSAPRAWKLNDPMPYQDSLQITDDLTPVGGGPKVKATFWVYHPFIGVHSVMHNGSAYIYRIASSPITHDNGVYSPPMFPGTTPATDGCGNDFRNMHDSNLVTRNCGGPNLVQFTNNTIKYRLRGRALSEKPPHTLDALDNMPDAFSIPGSLDSCKDNINWPFASDSLDYFWDFGDNGEACTTYFDANRNVQVKGNNPSGDPLLCRFSELPVPQHFYAEEGCWTATLSANDPVTGCTSTATQTIIMEAPDAGPADPAGAKTKNDVNYENQNIFQRDEDGDEFRMGMQLGRGAPPCVGNDLNPYFQNIDLSGTLPSCGRETFWMIFNRDDLYEGANDDPSNNDCQRNECSTDGNGFLIKQTIESRGALHKQGTYDIEWRVRKSDGSWGPARAKGVATINRLGYLEKVKITDDKGGYPNKAKAQMVFVDSSAFDMNDVKNNPIEVFAYEQVDTFWYDCQWIDENTLRGMSMRYSYSTPGCKTPGLVIKTGDCFDTFFYENYRYFIDANADFLMNPHPNRYVNEEEVRTQLDPFDNSPRREEVYKDVEFIYCQDPEAGSKSILPTRLPYEITFSVKDYDRNDPMHADADSICEALDSIRSFRFFITQTADQCGPTNKVVPVKSLEKMPDGFQAIAKGDTALINLRDTLKWLIKTPGKYLISSTSQSTNGAYSCFGSQTREVWIGQLQCFRYSDSVVCKEQEVSFIDSIYYWNFSTCTDFSVNTTCIDRSPYFYAPTHDSVRSSKWANYRATEMIAWDFNSPRFVTDEKGDTLLDASGNPVRMQDWMLKMDSLNMETWVSPGDSSQAYQNEYWNMFRGGAPFLRETNWTYGTTKEFGPGIYDVTMWVRDSLGCWMPYTKHDAIRVVDVEAKFTLCDTCKQNLTCTPAPTGFKDLSEIIENKKDAPPTGRSVTKGAFDEIVKWNWSFGDGRPNAVLQHPGHTYLDANEDGYDVTLNVLTAQGCKASYTIPNYIKIVGPKANFSLLTDNICVEDSIFVFDSTKSTSTAVRIWEGKNVETGLTGSSRNTFGKVKRVGLYFDEAGDYYITQSLSDTVSNPVTGVRRYCEDIYPNPDADETPIRIRVRDFDPLGLVLSDTLVCPDDVIEARVIDSTYIGYDTFYWNIHNVKDTALRDDVQEFSFSVEGDYKIELTGSGEQPICPTSAGATVTVKLVDAKVAINEARSDFDLGNYEFTNSSRNGELYVWTIYKDGDRRTPIDTFVRKDTSRLVYEDFVAGKYFIKLSVYDVTNIADTLSGCSDYDTLSVVVDPQIEFYNSFTPNDDGSNDVWTITMQAIPEYELVIYNRWGEPMYKATEEDVVPCEVHPRTRKRACAFWDGTNMRNGRDAPAGTYYYVFKYRFKGDDELKTVNGSITLLRGRK